MSTRTGNKWTVNECLQLQREYELLNLSIDEIASRHKRTPYAIMYKLDSEGFADYNNLYAEYSSSSDEQSDSSFDDEPVIASKKNKLSSNDKRKLTEIQQQIASLQKQLALLSSQHI
jgi:hypothetical protein